MPDDRITMRLTAAPPVCSDLVARPRLYALLDRLLIADGPERLGIVCAPAGSGKTTLLSAWLRERNPPAAWVSLDARDTIASLLDALAQGVGGQGRAALETAARLGNLSEDPERAVTTVARTLDALDVPITLILDDFHQLTDAALRQLIESLVRQPPPNLRLILAARTEPDLPLARLRVSGNLVEIRGGDLRFTPDDTVQFLQNNGRGVIRPEAAERITESAEGWAAGLRLMALSRARRAEADLHPATFLSANRDIVSYLVDEALANQPADVQEFLLLTALPERFSVGLAAELLHPPENAGRASPAPNLAERAADLLEYVERANLFLVPLSADGKWFRYHHLFGQMLRLRLQRRAEPAMLTELHRRASAHFENEGHIDEAIHHAATLGAAEAVVVFERNYERALEREDFAAVERGLAALPPDAAEHPSVLLARGWLDVLRHRFGSAQGHLQRLEAALRLPFLTQDAAHEQMELIRGRANAIRAGFFFRARPSESFAAASAALERLPHSESFSRRNALRFLALGLQEKGRGVEAATLLHAELDDAPIGGRHHLELLGTLCAVMTLNGDYAPMMPLAERLRDLGNRHDQPRFVAMGRFFSLMGLYFQNRLDEAADAAAREPEFPRECGSLDAYFATTLFPAYIHQARNDPAARDRAVEAGKAFALDVASPSLLQEAEATQAHLAFLRGDRATILQWADRQSPRSPDLTGRGFSIVTSPLTTLIRAQIARNAPEGYEAALESIEALENSTASLHYFNRRTRLSLLKAAALDGLGRSDEALMAAERAVEAARPSRLTGLLLDEGGEVCAVLYRLAKLRPDDEFLREVRAALPAADADDSAAVLRLQGASAALLNHPLTERESEILRFLATALPTKQIAARLGISPLTLKRHAARIYAKLQADSRRHAVEQARAFGLL